MGAQQGMGSVDGKENKKTQKSAGPRLSLGRLYADSRLKTCLIGCALN